MSEKGKRNCTRDWLLIVWLSHSNTMKSISDFSKAQIPTELLNVEVYYKFDPALNYLKTMCILFYENENFLHEIWTL